MIQNSRLLRMLRYRYPEIAQREVPTALVSGSHPENAIFSFRRRAVVVLRPHEDIWRERQRFVSLVIMAVMYLLGIAGIMSTLPIFLR